MNTITKMLLRFKDAFSTGEAYDAILNQEPDVKKPSIRARIYEAVDKGLLTKVAKGVYQNADALLIEGNGRDLSMFGDGTVDAIITDHPYDMKASNNGGNRHFAEYPCFRYEQKDFDEKARVLKEGCFLVEFLPEENGDNWEYLAQIKEMAQKAGLVYYAKVPWKKVGFVSNCGRKSKLTEDVLMFTKGKARCLRPDAKKDLADPTTKHYMSGANGMLPIAFEFAKPSELDMQAAKPVELLESIIDYVTKPHELIVDQFAGSGSTGIAAVKQQRQAIMFEIDHNSVEKICARMNLCAVEI